MSISPYFKKYKEMLVINKKDLSITQRTKKKLILNNKHLNMQRPTYLIALLTFSLFSRVLGQETTVSLTAIRDLSLGYHDYNSSASTNYDWAPQSAAFIIPGYSGGVNSNRALIDFDLSTIPEDAIIVDAKLNLYALLNTMNDPFTQGHIGENASVLQRITNQWNASTTTWNNQPASVTTNQVTLPTSTSSSQDYLDIDVKNIVQDMVSNPSSSYGFKLRLVNETLPSKGLIFCSLDHGNPSKFPTLTITYTVGCEKTYELPIKRDLSLGFHTNYNTANNNFGNAPQTASFIIPGAQGGVNINKGLLDFDWSMIPADETIVEAHLDLFALVNGMNSPFQDGHLGSNESSLRGVKSTWGEYTTTWNTQPTALTTNQVILPQSTTSNQDYLNIDVTSIVLELMQDPSSANGFLLELLNEELPSRGLIFASRHHTNPAKHPKLTVKTSCKLSVENTIEKSDLLIYPNPAKTNLFITFKNNTLSNYSISLIDLTGKEIIVKTNLEGVNHQLSLENVVSGLYMVKISDDKNQLTKMVVVQ